MKKIWPIVLILVSCLFLCACGNDRPNRTKKKVNSNSDGVLYYLVEQDQYENIGGSEKRIVEFDKFGMPIMYSLGDEIVEIVYDSNGNVMAVITDNGYCITTTEFDKFGYVIREYGEYHDNNDGMLDENGGAEGDYDREWHYVRDDAANIIEETKYRNGEVEYKRWNEYDEQGMLVYEKEEAGKRKHSRKFEYDENGNLVKTYLQEGDGAFKLSEEYEYDSSGNNIYSCTYLYECYNESDFIDKKISSERTAQYNEKGKILLEVTKYYSDDTGRLSHEYIYEYEYDDKGRCTKATNYRTDYEGGDGQRRLYESVGISYSEKPVRLTAAQAKVFNKIGLIY